LDYARFNSLRLPAAHQLDLRVDKEFYFRQWAFNLYFDMQNIYRSTDPANANRFLLRQIPGLRGTMLPTMDMMVKFMFFA
jgi:hypothetical protein